jgi:diguanylate cyclase (GGDEF)-like protein/PAS domain S-box-containing protein
VPDDVEGKRSAAERVFALADAAATGFALLDGEQRIVGGNRAYSELSGRDRETLAALSHDDLVHSDDRRRVRRVLKAVGEQGTFTSVDTRYTRPDGGSVPVRIVATATTTADGQPRVLLQALPSEAVPGSDEVFRQVFDLAPVPQATIALDATIMHVNQAAAELVGYADDELIGRPFARVMDAPSLAAATDAFATMLDGPERNVRIDIRLIRKDGSLREAEAFASAVLDESGTPMYFVALVQDVTEQRHREQQIWHLAVHDALTELPNRAWFLERLGQAVARGRREQSRLAVFFVDLDGFKEVNDTLGHESGDHVLFAAAGRMSRVLRPGDTLARYGGDEFTILCEDIPGEAEVAEIAERILTALREPFRVGGGIASVGASIGVALADAGAHAAPVLMEAADAAMYTAKSAGRGTFRIAAL